MINKITSLTYAFEFSIECTKYFGLKHDLYKTNSDLYGRWCLLLRFKYPATLKKPENHKKCKKNVKS